MNPVPGVLHLHSRGRMLFGDADSQPYARPMMRVKKKVTRPIRRFKQACSLPGTVRFFGPNGSAVQTVQEIFFEATVRTYYSIKNIALAVSGEIGERILRT